MDLFKVDKLNIAIDKLYNECINSNYQIDTELIAIRDSVDRIISNDILSTEDVPAFNKSIVDGYAVIASDTNAATETIPTFLDIVGESKMGQAIDIKLHSGQTVYVPTGAMIPENADAVVMIEHTEKFTDNKISIYSSVATGKNVIKKSDDIKKNNILLKKGRKITTGDIGLLSSLGISKIEVYKKIKISIISTGDELEEYTAENIPFGKIRDANSNMILAESKKNNFEIVDIFLIKDDEEALDNAVKNAKLKSDIVVLSGGSSKGKKDFSEVVIEKNSTTGILTHGIAIKPGKPTITAFDKNTETVLIGLPGHPTAAVVLFKLLVIALFDKLLNTKLSDSKVCIGRLTENIPASPGTMTVQLTYVDDNLDIFPVLGRSALVKNLSNANSYIIIDLDNEGYNKNDHIKAYYL